MSQRGPRGSLSDRGEVIWQAYQQHRVDHGRSGDQVAEPAAGEGEGLAHGAGHDELGRILPDQRHRARPRGELAISLVQDQDPGRRVQQPPQI